jgi:hypothetical protein
MASLAERIDDIEERHDVPPAPLAVPTPTSTFTPSTTPEPTTYTKSRLPNPEKFDRTDLAYTLNLKASYERSSRSMPLPLAVRGRGYSTVLDASQAMPQAGFSRGWVTLKKKDSS